MKTRFSVMALLLLTGSLYAAQAQNLHKAIFIKIERNLSKSYVKKVEQKAKSRGITMVINPTFNCTNAGFTQNDLFSQGTMYGRNRPDGSIEISGEGDFKAYHYKKYLHNERQCNDTTYTKAYDPARYGDQSYAVIMYP